MLIKPFSARALWTVAAFAVVYFYIAFTVQFPPGYWDPFTAVPAKPAPLPDCVLEAFTKGAPKPISIYPEKRLGELDGWDINPFVGSGWSNSPETEDYGALLTTADRRLLGELASSTDASDPKSARINTFYNLDTEEDWENYINELDDGGLAPLTKFAQKYLHAHQHPATCTDKKFLIFKKYPNDESFGLGAVVQSISTQLAIAIRDNRILIYDALEPPGMHFFQSPPPSSSSSSSNHTTACGQSLDCIFHKLTNCTHAAAAQAADVVHFPWNEQTPESAYKIHPNSLPVALGRALTTRFPDMIPDARKYWWRGQVAAYVMRPNGAAMQRLKELRMAPELHQGSQRTVGAEAGAATAAAEERELEMPFPLPEGAFSMHVRHGDKGIEMNLVPFRDYIARAEEHILKNPMSARRVAFLSTEDPGVIAEAKNISSLYAFSKDRSWEWYWSRIPRSNVGPETQLQQFGNRTEMTIKWLLQLTMALECETFVGTRGSGWNRLIDQLRCTWHSNCKSPYLEVGDDKSWAHYGF